MASDPTSNDEHGLARVNDEAQHQQQQLFEPKLAPTLSLIEESSLEVEVEPFSLLTLSSTSSLSSVASTTSLTSSWRSVTSNSSLQDEYGADTSNDTKAEMPLVSLASSLSSSDLPPSLSLGNTDDSSPISPSPSTTSSTSSPPSSSPSLSSITSASLVEGGYTNAMTLERAPSDPMAPFPIDATPHPSSSPASHSTISITRTPSGRSIPLTTTVTSPRLEASMTANAEGMKYYHGRDIGIARDYKRAFELFTKAAANDGVPSALYNQGHCYQMGHGTERDYNRAIILFRQAADKGVLQAMMALGGMYTRGQGVTVDHIEACKWVRMAAERDWARAQVSLAEMYKLGNGVEQSDEMAAHWFTRAAMQGHQTAMGELASCYEHGRGVQQSYTEAVKWYKRAAPVDGSGVVSAAWNLSRLLVSGRVTPDYDWAILLIRRMANRDQPSAQCLLAWMLANGYGCTRNIKEALQLYSKSASLGHSSAMTSLRLLQRDSNAYPPLPEPDIVHGIILSFSHPHWSGLISHFIIDPSSRFIVRNLGRGHFAEVRKATTLFFVISPMVLDQLG
jgi:TPR repeat protein